MLSRNSARRFPSLPVSIPFPRSWSAVVALKGRGAGSQQCNHSHMLGRPHTAERVLAWGGVRRSWHVHNDHSSASRTSGLPKPYCRCFTKFALSLHLCWGGTHTRCGDVFVSQTIHALEATSPRIVSGFQENLRGYDLFKKRIKTTEV